MTDIPPEVPPISQVDTSTMTVKEVVVSFLIPRVERMDVKTDDYRKALDDFQQWRARVNTAFKGVGLILTGLVIPVTIAVVSHVIGS
jgi:hypothetical protein